MYLCECSNGLLPMNNFPVSQALPPQNCFSASLSFHPETPYLCHVHLPTKFFQIVPKHLSFLSISQQTSSSWKGQPFTPAFSPQLLLSQNFFRYFFTYPVRATTTLFYTFCAPVGCKPLQLLLSALGNKLLDLTLEDA